jgi:cholesterol transport system auxiliary component
VKVVRAFVSIIVAGLLAPTGCALTSRGEVLDVRWFTPERAHAQAAPAVPAAGPSLRLGRVTSGTDLGQRIVHGDGAYEVSYYEDRRWTERPELYVRRALDRTLFEDRGFRRELEGGAPTLDVEVLAFEEIKTASAHAARVVLRIVLSADHVLFEDTAGVLERVTGDRFEDVVAAMSRALDATSEDVARRVGAALAKRVSAVP